MIELVHDNDREPEVGSTTIILPPDVYWPLRLHVPQGGCTSFVHMMLWAWQFQRTQVEA